MPSTTECPHCGAQLEVRYVVLAGGPAFSARGGATAHLLRLEAVRLPGCRGGARRAFAP